MTIINPIADYLVISVALCFVYMACLWKLDRASKMNFWAFFFAGLCGTIFICLCLRYFVFEF